MIYFVLLHLSVSYQQVIDAGDLSDPLEEMKTFFTMQFKGKSANSIYSLHWRTLHHFREEEKAKPSGK